MVSRLELNGERRSIAEHWATGETFDQLHENLRANKTRWEPYSRHSFKFIVTAYNQTLSKSQQRQRMESLSYMNFDGIIDLANPNMVMEWWEECELPYVCTWTAADAVGCVVRRWCW